MIANLKDWQKALALAALLLALQALLLYFMGQPATSTTHSLMLWAGTVLSSENSQHLSDWYTFSHIIHGLLFYALLRFLFPRMPMWQRFAIAVGIEAAWEVLENTPMVIDHYRQQALAQGYVGDSIINSISDTCAMMLGFLFAMRTPVWASIALGLGLELWVIYSIRDGLSLNILGFFWTPDFIARWQSGS